MAIDILREFLNPVIPYKVIDVNPIPDEVKFINVFGLQKILKIVNVVFEKGPGFFAWFLGLAELENVAETGCEQGSVCRGGRGLFEKKAGIAFGNVDAALGNLDVFD